MGYSFSLKIDRYVRNDGCSAVYFLVIINRDDARIGLDFAWPKNKFSETKGCLPRQKDDEYCATYNIVIGNARTKANNIHKEYLIKGKHLTLAAFLREYHSDLNKNDFISYIDKKAFERWNKKEIGDDTYDAEKSIIKKLTEYQPSIPFNGFNHKWAKGFDNHLKKKYNNGDNTRWGNHKVVMTYLNIARDIDKINFDDPYARFTNSLVESSWGPLDLDQLKKLLLKYEEWKDRPLPNLARKNGLEQTDDRPGLTASEVIVLRKFLFACNSSLRISDLQKLDELKFINGQMSLRPHKTERFGTLIKDVPLNEFALQLLEDEIEFVKQQSTLTPYLKIQRQASPKRIFESYVDQSCNKILKRIARKTGIEINLHMHVARYTFGSLMDESGANHTALMKMMGIKKRDTLEKYVKTNRKRIVEDVARFNAFMNAKPSDIATTE